VLGYFFLFFSFFNWRLAMRPVRRSGVNKSRSARRFRRDTTRTKSPNMSLTPMRGGWRL